MAEAFELRAQRKDRFDGGSVTLHTGKSYDYGRALKQGDGVIVTNDPELAERLREVPALKQVDVPDAKPKTTTTAKPSGSQAP